MCLLWIFLAFIVFTHPICYFPEGETCMNHLMTILERFSCGADIPVCRAGLVLQGYIISVFQTAAAFSTDSDL